MNDTLVIGGHEFHSRFILGSGKFSLEMTDAVIKNGGVEMATLAIRRANVGGEENILDYMPQGITLLPNTPARGLRRRLSGLPDWPENWGAGIL